MRRRSWTREVVLGLGVLLSACATPGPPARPADFPFHTGDGRSVLHWRLDRTDGAVEASGLVEVGGPEFVMEVVLELQGFDQSGRLVSRALDRAVPRTFTGTEPWSFTVRARATGQEDRWTVHVRDYVAKPFRGR
jgi:hypothetical protein